MKVATLPTNRDINASLQPIPDLPAPNTGGPPDLSRLLRPRVSAALEWEPMTEGVEVRDVDLRLTVPTYPIFGPPPPMITSGFSYTSLTTPDDYRIPSSFYDVSFGAVWMRPIHERWLVRIMASAAYATDGNNTSSDAWQFRGGVFATYEWTEDLQLVVGALASGREDIPVLPGIGAVWTPTPFWRVDLMMPRPRVSYMIAHDGERQHWIFLGAGLSGGTWAFEDQGVDDKLTYREWRLSLGWSSGPPRGPGMMLNPMVQWEAEIGYVFGREFELNRREQEVGVANTLLLRLGTSF